MERPNIDQRARAVRRVLVIEGLCNLALALTELSVGLMTGSWVLVADAMHSATDLANNVVAWFAMRVAGAPADATGPSGAGDAAMAPPASDPVARSRATNDAAARFDRSTVRISP